MVYIPLIPFNNAQKHLFSSINVLPWSPILTRDLLVEIGRKSRHVDVTQGLKAASCHPQTSDTYVLIYILRYKPDSREGDLLGQPMLQSLLLRIAIRQNLVGFSIHNQGNPLIRLSRQYFTRPIVRNGFHSFQRNAPNHLNQPPPHRNPCRHTMTYQHLGAPYESAVTNHNSLCLALDSISAQFGG
jgi:hypothetical protein